MRNILILLGLAALLALPAANAMGEVTLTAPEVDLHVEGRTIDAGRYATKAGSPADVDAEFTVDDVDVSLSETQCSVSTKASVKEMYGDDAAACRAGELRGPAAPGDLVRYRIDVRLPEEALGPEEAPADVDTATAATGDAPVPQTVLLAAAAASASLAGLYGIWRILRWTGLAAFLPLYSHISDDELLDDPNRGAIYKLIKDEPGISTKDIADRLDLAWGTVTHHLTKLEKRRFVVSKKYGKYRRFFANGEGGTQHKDALATLRLDRTGDVAALIQARPGVTQKEVSGHLGVSSSTILWHVKRLEAAGLVRKVRDGKLVRYYPAEGMRDVTLITPAATSA